MDIHHIAEHDVAPEEVEDILQNRRSRHTVSRTSGNRLTFGYTSTGRHLAALWEKVLDDPLTAYPLTAYEAPEPHS